MRWGGRRRRSQTYRGPPRARRDGRGRRRARRSPIEATIDTIAGAHALMARGRVRMAQGRTADAIADLRRVGERRPSRTRTSSRGARRSRWRSLPRSRTGGRARGRRARASNWFAQPRAIGVALRACGLLAGGEDGIATLATQSSSSGARRRGSSSPGRCSTSAPLSAAPASGAPRASRSARRSTSLSNAERVARSADRRRARGHRGPAPPGPLIGAGSAHAGRAARRGACRERARGTYLLIRLIRITSAHWTGLSAASGAEPHRACAPTPRTVRGR